MDLAELNLGCAVELPGSVECLHQDCVEKLDDWAALVERFTSEAFPYFQNTPKEYDGWESQFRVTAMVDFFQRQIGLHYNFDFAEGDFDATDSRNLFIGGILTGFGGTCSTLPVFYTAIAQRLGYPLRVCATWEHLYCSWEGLGQDQFCFDVTGRGFVSRCHEDYRRFHRPVSTDEERQHGFLRTLTRKELLAIFARDRSMCLQEHFRFAEALEANFLACEMAPHIGYLNVSWGTCYYTKQLWQQLADRRTGLNGKQLERAVRLESRTLSGPDSDSFTRLAGENLLRIFRNRHRHVPVECHDRVITETQLFSTPQT